MKTQRAHALVVAACLLVQVTPGVAQDCPEHLGGLPFGWVEDVAASGDHMFYTAGSGVRIVDVSTPSVPTVVGQVFAPWWVRGVAAQGTFLFLTTKIDLENYLLVFDVSDPSTPVEVGSCVVPRNAYGVTVVGDYAYVAWGESPYKSTRAGPPWGGIRIIDVSDPTSPVTVGSATTPWGAHQVVVEGEHAYVIWWEYNFSTGDYDGGLEVIDVSDPTLPAAVGSHTWPGCITYGVGVYADTAYVTTDPLGIRIMDVSDPSAPVEVGSQSWVGRGLTISGSHAFVGIHESGLRIFDLNNPWWPASIGFVSTPGSAEDVAITGTIAGVADGAGGLRVVDISTVSSPVELGSVGTVAEDFAFAVTTRDNWAFVAADDAGFQVIDISDPAISVEVGSWQTVEDANDVAVQGDYAYVAAGTYDGSPVSALYVIDISTPSAPVQVGEWSYPASEGLGVAVELDLAVLVGGGSLHVIDISSHFDPIGIGYANTPGGAEAVVLEGDYAYVAYGAGLGVYDLTVPSAPVRVGWWNGNGAKDVALSNDLALLADSTWGLRVIDVKYPTQPILIGGSFIAGGLNGVAVRDDIVYATSWTEDDFWIIDFSDPSAPSPIGGFHGLLLPYDVSLIGDLAVVAAHGLRVFDVTRCQSEIFSDGFESSDTSMWTEVIR